MKQRIMVELDAMLDTRLGTLAKLNMRAAELAVADVNFNKRTEDDFTKYGVNRADFIAAYNARDVATLKLSHPTGFQLCLEQMCNALEETAAHTPFISGILISVNVWPYRLSEAEATAIEVAVMQYTGIDGRVELVNIPLDQLTSTVIRDRWDGVILYNHVPWLKANIINLVERPIPTVSILVPALYEDKAPTENEVIREIGFYLDPLVATEMSMTRLCDYHVIDVRYFSLFL